jgi:hypothetical protein
MPETAVYKYDLSLPGKDNIGMSRKAWYMKPIPISHFMEELAHDNFGLRIFAFDPTHVFTSALACDRIHLPLKRSGYKPIESLQFYQAAVLTQPLRYQIGCEMNGSRERRVRVTWWTVAQNLLQAVGSEFTNNREKIAIRIVTMCCA